MRIRRPHPVFRPPATRDLRQNFLWLEGSGGSYSESNACPWVLHERCEVLQGAKPVARSRGPTDRARFPEEKASAPDSRGLDEGVAHRLRLRAPVVPVGPGWVGGSRVMPSQEVASQESLEVANRFAIGPCHPHP